MNFYVAHIFEAAVLKALVVCNLSGCMYFEQGRSFSAQLTSDYRCTCGPSWGCLKQAKDGLLFVSILTLAKQFIVIIHENFL